MTDAESIKPNQRQTCLNGRNVVVGVTGGIAAYKSPELVRQLKAQGADVRVVMTRAAREFITPLTLQAVSGHRIHDQLLDPDAEAGMGHIELARWADDVIVAPATADVIARLANGHADDLLTTLVLATRARIWVAPAMNQAMWAHPAVVENSDRLQYRGVHMLGPDRGSQACGDEGYGRMREPDALVQDLIEMTTGQVNAKSSETAAPVSLSGQRFIVTAGPTFEDLDPVRYIGNRSSGRMGFALAAALRQVGAEVLLISGPVTLDTPAGVHRIDVRSAEQMHAAVLSALPADGFIGVAAVADYRPKQKASNKIKKQNAEYPLELVRNPDILAEVASRTPRPFMVGFAAETHKLEEHARSKLKDKQLDLIAANNVADGQGFKQAQNALDVFSMDRHWSFPLQDKADLARKLVDLIAELMHSTH